MNRMARTVIRTAALAIALSGLAGCQRSAPVAESPEPVATQASSPSTPVQQPAPAAQVGRPTRVTIDAIDVKERLHRVGLADNGSMEMPDFGEAGWYDRGPRPGAVGPAVIVAHVHGPDGDDVFARLDDLDRGDRVTVDRVDGSSSFVVDSVESATKESLPYDRIWGETAGPALRLITCGGTPDPSTRVYPKNTIVYAHVAS